MKLAINQEETFKIRAFKQWNDTNLEIKAGETYVFTSTGKWFDFFICCDANGYKRWYLKYAEKKRRAPGELWFALMGSINHGKKQYYQLYSRKPITFEESGQLTCFANDLKCMYFNNWGKVKLVVKRIG